MSTLAFWYHGVSFDWYIPVQLFYYLIAPFVFSLLEKAKKRERMLLCMLLAALLLLFLPACVDPIFQNPVERVPSFLVGIYLGWAISKSDAISRPQIGAYSGLFAISICGTIWIQGMEDCLLRRLLYHYPACCFAVSFCVLFSCFLEKLEGWKPGLQKILCGTLHFFGTISFEIYLLHRLFLAGMPRFLGINSLLVIAAVTVAASWVLGKTLYGGMKYIGRCSRLCRGDSRK